MNDLRAIIAEQRRTIRRLEAALKKQPGEPVPARCARCGCEKLYKNGMTSIHLKRILNIDRNGFEYRIPVQKFVCVNCGAGAHLKGPPALYHWIVRIAGERK
ncbi:MAG: hypothetical protein PHN82_03085 [bacterium]|nr:hypothetical protein [bacterium]